MYRALEDDAYLAKRLYRRVALKFHIFRILTVYCMELKRRKKGKKRSKWCYTIHSEINRIDNALREPRDCITWNNFRRYSCP